MPPQSLSQFSLEGTVALVTGAGKGIGRACALTLSQAGARLIVVARTEADLETLADECPGAVECWSEDVTSDSFIERMATLTQLDILVNNVGTNKPQPLVDVQRETLDLMLDLNVRSAFLVAQSAARQMVAQGHGSIINIGSQMGHVGAANRTVYCMTKHAIEGLTKAMAVELAPAGVRVNTVAPTFIETPMTRPMLEDPDFRRDVISRIPLGQVGRVDDVANAVLFLASRASRMVTGDSLKVDGGWTAV